MSKKRTSVSIDADVAERLSSDPSVNFSGLVNRLLKQYMNGDVDGRYMLELRESQLKSDIESLESQLETKREELSRVQDRLEDRTDQVERVIEEAVETMSIHPSEGHDHLAAENWADKADLTPEAFWQRYTERWHEVNDGDD